jgi:hypothetical protein
MFNNETLEAKQEKNMKLIRYFNIMVEGDN